MYAMVKQNDGRYIMTEIKHYGKGHLDGGHSGRYPWGSENNKPVTNSGSLKTVFGKSYNDKNVKKIVNKTVDDKEKSKSIFKKVIDDLKDAFDGYSEWCRKHNVEYGYDSSAAYFAQQENMRRNETYTRMHIQNHMMNSQNFINTHLNNIHTMNSAHSHFMGF